MKRLNYASAVLCAVMFSTSIHAQNAIVTGATFSPLPVTNCQNTTANIDVTKYCTNINLDSIALDMSAGRDTAEIYIYYSLGPFCLGAIANVTENQGMGNIPANISSVHVNIILNQSAVDDAYYPITVTSCCSVAANFTRSTSASCPSDTVFFTNTSLQATQYRWYVGNTMVSTSVDFDTALVTPGTYVISLASESAVCGDSTSKLLTVIDPSFDIGADTTVCLDGSYSLFAGVGLDSVIWSTGDRGRYLPVTQSGLIYARAYRGGCEAYDTILITGLSMPAVELGSDTTICLGDSLLLDATHSNAASYVWQDSSTASSYWVNASGMYYVTLTSADGCVVSDSITVEQDTCSGIYISENRMEQGFELYPNPANEVVSLQIGNLNGSVSVELITPSGRCMMSLEVPFENGHGYLNVTEWSSGLYYVKARFADREWVMPLILE